MLTINRRLIFAVLAVAAISAGFALLRPRPLEVDTDIVTEGPLQVALEEEGETQVRDRYLVTAPVSGQLRRITLEAGDRVRAGETLAQLQPSPLDSRAREAARARLAQAEDADRAARAQVISVRAGLEQARRDRIRAEELSAEHALAPAALEAAVLEETTRLKEMESADFRQQAAAHEVEAARAVLAGGARATLRLQAPVSGTILRVPEPSARVIAVGDPIIEIGDCGTLEIVTDLLSADAVQVEPGDLILIDDWGGDQTLRGRVRRIEPSGFTRLSALGVEEQRVNVIGDLLEVPATLGDRYRVQVRIVIWEGSRVRKLPASALFRDGKEWKVFVIQDGRARLRSVRVGHQTPFEAEIEHGVTTGERVLLSPSDQVRDGIRVTGMN